MYVGSDDDSVYALNATNGAEIWNYPMPNGNIQNGAPVNEVQSSPSVVNGVVYVGSGDGNVYALNADNGKKIWNYTTENFGGNTGNSVASSPAVVNGVVYVGSYNGFVYALKASNGAEIWSSEIGSITVSSPAVASGVVYIGSGYYGTGDENVYTFNAATGKLLWSYRYKRAGLVVSCCSQRRSVRGFW